MLFFKFYVFKKAEPQQPRKKSLVERFRIWLFPDSDVSKWVHERKTSEQLIKTEENEEWLESKDNPDSEDIDSESEIEIDESEEYSEEW